MRRTDGYRSRNTVEESLLLVLRSMVPTSVKVIVGGGASGSTA
jgi:hypothetical protein